MQLKIFIRNLISRPSLQPLWERTLKLSFAGLNAGGGQSIGDSGEIGALSFAAAKNCRTGPFILFDVGANDGLYLRMAREVIGEPMRGFAFEPQTTSFRGLEKQYADAQWVTLTKLALGRQEATAMLHSQMGSDVRASFLPDEDVEGLTSESVAVTTVDRFCEKNGISYIDFLKIDTEGTEMEVILGSEGMINAGKIYALQFEFGSDYTKTPYHFSDFWELLAPKYEVYRILRKGVGRIRNYSFDLEIYKTANYLCLLRQISDVT